MNEKIVKVLEGN